jgi:hypothetical protein
MDGTTEEIETRRLGMLEQQAALYGPQTDPSILIEIQELKHKGRSNTVTTRKHFVGGLDYDFLMNVVAAALVRLGSVEASLKSNDIRRQWRQLIHDLWMVIITIMVFLLLVLQVYGR